MTSRSERQAKIKLKEYSVLRRIQEIDQKRYKLYQERMEWKEKLEQVQAEKYRLKNSEVIGDE